MHVVLRDTALSLPLPGFPLIIGDMANLQVEFQNSAGIPDDIPGTEPQLRLYDPQQEPLEITETELWQWDDIALLWRVEITIDALAPLVMLARFSRGDWLSDFFHVVRASRRKNLGLAEQVQVLTAQMPRPASLDQAQSGTDERTFMSPLTMKQSFSALLQENLESQFSSSNITALYAESLNFASSFGNSVTVDYVFTGELQATNVQMDTLYVNEHFEAPGISSLFQSGDTYALALDATLIHFTPQVSVNYNTIAVDGMRNSLRNNYRSTPLSVSTVGTLPAASISMGHLALVTDSNGSPTGSQVFGGGNKQALVCSNGSVWRIVLSFP